MPSSASCASHSVAHLVEAGDGAVHREHAVGEHELEARAVGGRLREAALQVGHVVVLVAVALRLAQADAVDDGRVVQLVADDGVVLAQQRLEEAAVRIEGSGVEDRVLGAEEARQPRLQRLVQVLRAADEAHRAQAVAVRAQRLVGRLDHRRVRRQAEVVVGAQVEHLAAVGRAHEGALRRGDDALGLVEAGLPDGVQLGAQMVVKSVVHRFVGAAGRPSSPGTSSSIAQPSRATSGRAPSACSGTGPASCRRC